MAGRRSYLELERVFEDRQAPFAFVDLDALESNAVAMLNRAAGKPIRVATKSIRSFPMLERIFGLSDLPASSRFSGLMAFTLPEGLELHRRGWEDVLVAYPSVDRGAIARLAEIERESPGTSPVITIDSPAHLDMIESALTKVGGSSVNSGGGKNGSKVRVCIDIDASLRLAAGRLDIGVKRSPIHTREEAVELAKRVSDRPGIELVGLMAYEAQVAGVGDRPAGRPARGAAIRWIKQRSVMELMERRTAIVDAVRAVADLRFVNGGGTGSIASTARERAVSEIAAGSGFYTPHQFDAYDDLGLLPAAGFAVPIVRKPSPTVATALGGGYLASGPGDRTRVPVPWLPTGLKLDSEEGAGEVQTPLIGDAAARLSIGDRVYLRHMKAGELCERFNSLLLVRGSDVVDEVPTYRGEGYCFL